MQKRVTLNLNTLIIRPVNNNFAGLDRVHDFMLPVQGLDLAAAGINGQFRWGSGM